MTVLGHFKRSYNNAFWIGIFVAVGDGDQSYFRELSSLDVIGHEFGHAVTEQFSNLIYRNESGALSESFSDMMGNSIEFYADANNLEPSSNLGPDWFIGEEIYVPADDAPGFRNMLDPEEDGLGLDHYSERYTGSSDNGGVHWNSAIPNHAYYLAVNGGKNARAFSDHSGSYPELAKKLAHSVGVKSSMISAMASHRSSTVRAAAFLSRALSLAKACSMGLKSGE